MIMMNNNHFKKIVNNLKLQIDRKKIYVQIDFYFLKNNSDRLLIKKYNYSKFELIENKKNQKSYFGWLQFIVVRK